jgi:L-iditol 2-dehydrogenase
VRAVPAPTKGVFVKQAILEAPRRFSFVDIPIPEPGPEQVLVKVAACGVCTSELDVWDGSTGGKGLPRAIGHEVSGVVAGVGPEVTGLKEGDPVGVWTTGGFSEYVAVDATWCYPAGNVPLDLALAEPVACAVNAVEMADPKLGDDVVVIGAGFMGNLVQKLAALRGPRHLIVADTRSDALERATRLGATHVVDVTKESLKEVVQSVTDGRGADMTFEVTGAQAPLTAAGEITRMSGTIAIVGYHQSNGGERTIPLASWNWMAFRIANAHFRDQAVIRRGMEVGMRLMTSGRLDLSDVVTHRFPLDQVGQAFETAHTKPEGFAKATVVVSPQP